MCRPFRGFTTSGAGQPVRRRHERPAIGRFESTVSAVGSDYEIGFGPRTVERPRGLHGTNDVVTTLYDHPGDVTDARGVAQQLVIGFEETFVDEVVSLNASEGQGELILFVVAGKVRVGQQLGGDALPSAPDLGRGEPHGAMFAR